MSQNINKTTRHLKFCYISILTNLLRTRLNVSLFYLYTYYIYIISILYKIYIYIYQCTCLYLLKNLNINFSQFYCLFDLSKDLIHSEVFAIQYSSVV